MNETGKISEGKVSYKEIEWDFIEAMAKRFNDNKGKYPEFSWKTIEDITGVEDALVRHVLAYLKKDPFDSETPEDHLAAAGVNLQIIYYLRNFKKK
jgi:hypothetical protein